MKTFEQNSIRIGKTHDGIVMGMAELSETTGGRRGLLYSLNAREARKNCAARLPKPRCQRADKSQSLVRK